MDKILWHKSRYDIPEVKNKKEQIPVFVLVETRTEVGSFFDLYMATFGYQREWNPETQRREDGIDKLAFHIESGDQFTNFFVPDYFISSKDFDVDEQVIFWMHKSDLELPDGISLDKIEYNI